MVYCGMDIGTAKPTVDELRRYPHQLIDIRDPSEPYTAADFVSDADECVRAAFAAQQVPVIVGGTMLYVKRFVEGIAELPAADSELRQVLTQRLAAEGAPALHAQLQQLDAVAAAGIHPNNSQRLLRALEVVILTGNQAMSAQWQQQSASERLQAPLLLAGLVPQERADLHARIEQRFAQMLQDGFLEEARQLYERDDLNAELPSMRAVGYRQAWQHFAGELDFSEFSANTMTATRRLAKRQLTWMRGWSGLQLHSGSDLDAIARDLLGKIDK